ncbi:hypothetical protein PBY51_006461 [Eleginops maclovinus]|uniref:Ig-like domain-containing protein n=1 Tax=Eleginops maclovinus TaxID=56733 RepID=A0AAN7X243_ELEMC|nr:hypothetical protein PBY51_006461 [Eleginops maclovinus]
MADFRWIEVFLFLTLITLTAGAILPYEPDPVISHTVRSGKEVTLPCKVTKDDAGRYTCRQSPQFQEVINLAVVTMAEHKSHDKNYELLKCRVNEFNHKVNQLFSPQFSGGTTEAVSALGCVMLAMRVAQILLLTVITVLLLKYRGNQRPPDDSTVHHDGNRRGGTVTQFRSGQQQGPDSLVDLSVVTMTEHQDTDESSGEDTKPAKTNPPPPPPPPTTTTTTANNNMNSGWWWGLIVVTVGVAALTIISVAVIRRKRTQGQRLQMDENMQADPEDGVSYASISYTRTTNHAARGKYDDDEVYRGCNRTGLPLLSVRIRSGEQQGPDSEVDLSVVTMTEHQDTDETFSLQSSGEDDGAAKTKTPTPTPTTTTSQNIKQPDWWLYLFLALVLVALLIIIVAIIRWRKMKGKEARTKDSVDLTSNSAKTAPETSQADPEDGVSYASVSYTKKTNKKAQVKVKKDVDEGDAVTYTTVKASTIDPSSLYATIY